MRRERPEVKETAFRIQSTPMRNGEGCVIGTGGVKKGPSQFSVSGETFDLFDDIDQSPDYWRDSPVTQNPAERDIIRGDRHKINSV